MRHSAERRTVAKRRDAKVAKKKEAEKRRFNIVAFFGGRMNRSLFYP